MSAGEEARDGQRYVDALVQYEAACALSEDDADDACREAEAARAPAASEMARRFTKPCREGDIPLCLEGLGEAPESIREDPALVALRNQAGKRNEAACVQAYDETLDGLVRRTRCMEGLGSWVNSKTYDAAIAQHRHRTASALQELANYVGTGSPGATLIVLDAAEHFESTGGAAVDRARNRFLASAYVKLVVNAEFLYPETQEFRDYCPAVKREVGKAVRCESGGLVFDAQLRGGDMTSRTWTEEHSTRYQSESRLVDNPAYQTASRRAHQARGALTAVDSELAHAKAKCTAAQTAEEASQPGSDSQSRSSKRARRLKAKRVEACAVASELATLRNARNRERADAARQLSGTPPRLEEPVFDTHQWTSQHYEWSLPYSFTIDGPGATTGDRGTAIAKKMSQPGFPPANVRRLHFGSHLSYANLYEEARAHLLRAVAERVRVSLETWSQDREAACPKRQRAWTAAWLQCQAEAAHWGGRQVGRDLVLGRIE